jgi:hypothetical protein
MSKATEEITLPQAAHLLRKDPQWVRARVIRGELTGRQIAGRWFVELDSALRLQAQPSEREQK